MKIKYAISTKRKKCVHALGNIPLLSSPCLPTPSCATCALLQSRHAPYYCSPPPPRRLSLGLLISTEFKLPMRFKTGARCISHPHRKPPRWYKTFITGVVYTVLYGIYTFRYTQCMMYQPRSHRREVTQELLVCVLFCSSSSAPPFHLRFFAPFFVARRVRPSPPSPTCRTSFDFPLGTLISPLKKYRPRVLKTSISPRGGR